ncbi:RodZ domain-containing protein [Stutzerimonas azotifigens]|uniref:Helix-turn-helix domain-containing protein n=1 Tax=Stutzerimonas azotifigens TaxID=291995 RepID=A0ABR5Z2D3_9GAMM|nr:RodZ family helix-turn-helix domain-containing protein [Stutzerimonas azotifigens]MBA1274356.1 helix-turn-helix domain-containing protein [Stutzerimonas azotifigens]
MKVSQPEAVVPTSGNPGETLRHAREAKGWSVAAVASQLNLSERLIGQIEAGDFSQAPGHTFARGYVRAYAKLVGLDQTQLVGEFDRYTGTDASGSSVHALGRIEEPVRLSHNVLRFFSFVLLLVLIGAGFIWWQDQSSRNTGSPASSSLEHIEVEGADGTTQIHVFDEPEDQAVEAGRQSEDISLPSLVGQQPDAEGEAPLELSQGSEAAEATVPEADITAAPASQEQQDTAAPASAPPESEPAASDAALETPETPSATAQAPAAVATGEGQLELSFTADCWTRVIDADGRVLVSALIRAGTTRTVTGRAPLDIHLGYARGAQVSYNGESVSLAPHLRGETARFKVGQ